MLKAIDRIVKAAAVRRRAPEPEVKVNLEEFTPATLTTCRSRGSAARCSARCWARRTCKPRQPVMGAEDFGRYSEGKMPIFMYFLGTVSQGEVRRGAEAGRAAAAGDAHRQLRPVPEPSIRTGVRTMSLAAMNLMPKEK